MFRYQCTIFREHKMPGLKPFDNDKLLFTRCTVISSPLVHVDYIYIRYNLYLNVSEIRLI